MKYLRQVKMISLNPPPQNKSYFNAILAYLSVGCGRIDSSYSENHTKNLTTIWRSISKLFF